MKRSRAVWIACALWLGGRGVAAANPAPPGLPAFCKDSSAVERIDRVLVCREGGHSYSASSLHGRTGWSYQRADGPVAFTADEDAHVDRALADGIAKLCRGDDDPRIAFPSLHRKELGWPMPRCRGQEELVLVKGRSRLRLQAPRVAELAEVYWIAALHELDRKVVWNH